MFYQEVRRREGLGLKETETTKCLYVYEFPKHIQQFISLTFEDETKKKKLKSFDELVSH